MSRLATRCPVCRSLFRVTAEQLHARLGQVRCGKCNAVFDGVAQLLPESQRQIEALARGASAGEPRVPDIAVASEAPTPEPAATPTASSHLSSSSAVASPAPGAAVAGGSEWLERFIRKLPKFQVTRHRAVIAGLLLVLLAGQLMLRNRAELVGNNPSLRPIVAGLCAVVGCELSLPRNVERISIHGDEMFAANPQQPNLVTLVANLKNAAPYTVAYPAIELTLQDAREQPLARRVLAPAEYLERGTDIANGLPGRGEAPLRLALDTGALRAEGYRLQLYYPRAP